MSLTPWSLAVSARPVIALQAQPTDTWMPGRGGPGFEMLVAVVIVVGVLALWVWLMRRGMFGRRGHGAVAIETAVPLGERRSLVIVSIEGRRLLLGLTPSSVSLVTALDAGRDCRVLRRSGAGGRPRKRWDQMTYRGWVGGAVVAVVLGTTSVASAQPSPLPPALQLDLPSVGTISAPLQVLLLLTFLTFVPAVLVTMTAFTRIVIVFHFLRHALGTQEMPSNQILLGLALFLTMFVMAPVAARINTAALEPAVAGTIGLNEAVTRAVPPLREFMLRHTRQNDLALFAELAQTPTVQTAEELSLRVVIPAYVISELKTGFQMGFFIFVPFLLIDLVVSTTLLSMGMLQLPPMMISLPFKVMLFVMIDGWNLLVGSVVRSFL